MSVVKESLSVPFKATEMYMIVNDVKAYPEFLPWCVGAEILHQDETSMRAKISIRKGRFAYSLTTFNQLFPCRVIELDFVEGPFKCFQGRWRFDSAEEGCLVQLDLDFEAKNRILDMALAAASRPVTARLMTAFRDRAYKVCG